MARHGVELSAEAVSELREAQAWYRQRSPAAAKAFAVEVEATVERIVAQPNRFAPYLHGTRRAVLRRFPYLVVYLIQDTMIVIIAVAYAGRDEGYWVHRTPPAEPK